VVNGRLDLQHGRIDQSAFSGVIALRTRPGEAVITPETLLADFGNKKPLPVRVTSGALKLAGTKISADALRVSFLGGSSLLNGNFDWHADSGELGAEWVDLTLATETEARHSGRMSMRLDRTIAGGPQIKGELSTRGHMPRGSWDGRMTIDADGPGWNQIDWRLAIPHLNWDDAQYDVKLADLHARLSTRDSVIRLDSVRVADTNRINASGLYDGNTGDWWLWTDARGVYLPISRYARPADVMFNATGAREWINLSDLHLTAGHTTISAYGFYDFTQPKPLSASVHVWRPVRDPAAPTPQEALAAQKTGILRGDLKVTGIVTQPDIEISGEAFGENVIIGQRELGDLRVAIRGNVTPKGAALWSERLQLLEGRWAFRGDYDRQKDLATLHVDALGLSLGQADAFFKPPPNLVGMLDAELHMDVPHRDREQLSASGDFLVTGFKKGQITADEVRGAISFENDQLTISNIELENERGTGNGEVKYNLNDPGRVGVKLAVRDWPLQTRRQNIRLRVAAETALEIDTKTSSINGPLSASGSIVLREADAGTFSAAANFKGRQIDLQSLVADVLDGRLQGRARIDMNDVLASTAQFDWADFDAGFVQEMFPAIEGLEGRVSGNLSAGKAVGPHVEAPMRVQLEFQSNGASYEDIEIGDGRFTFLLDRTQERPNGLPDRVVLERSTLELADGLWEIWARASTPSERLFGNVHTQITFRDVDLKQIVRGFAPEAQPMVGSLAGEITVFGDPANYRNLYGEANLKLTRSDLINSDVIGAFYNVFNLAPDTPHGRGNAYARLEAGTLRIINLYYRITGLEVRASGEVEDVWLKADSPIAGHAAGSVRQLGDIELPLFAEVDEILTALQQGLVTVEVGGTVRDPKVRPVLFSDINSDLRTFLLGDVKAATKGTAGR
jgi:hypothetical protein